MYNCSTNQKTYCQYELPPYLIINQRHKLRQRSVGFHAEHSKLPETKNKQSGYEIIYIIEYLSVTHAAKM